MNNQNLKTSRRSLVTSVLTLTTVLIWVLAEIYRALTVSQIPEVLQRQIAPLNPQISQNVLDRLEKRSTLPLQDNPSFIDSLENQAVLENQPANTLQSTQSGQPAASN